jgi:phenylalanyl-tRNA synthetase beta chain
MMSIFDVSTGGQASNVFDKTGIVGMDNRSLEVTPQFVNERLGLSLSVDEIKAILTHVECVVSGNQTLLVQPPFWRMDIELPEDIVEEVGRLYGFDKLPRELPQRSIKPVAKNASRKLAQTVRERLARAGANEVLTYSFVHENVLTHAGQDASQAFRLGNALSPDLQYYRLSLTPSLLDKVHGNVRAGYDEFALFEIGKAHNKQATHNNEDLPDEQQLVALTIAGSREAVNSPYYKAKAYADYLAGALSINFAYKSLEQSLDAADMPFEPKRSAHVYDVQTGQRVGIVGEYHASVIRAFKLPVAAAGFELNLQALAELAGKASANYVPLSRYPGSERDICFQVDSDISYQQIVDAAKDALVKTQLETTILPIDIYSAPDSTTKNVTVRVELASYDKTLTGNEVSKVIELVAAAVVTATNAVII